MVAQRKPTNRKPAKKKPRSKLALAQNLINATLKRAQARATLDEIKSRYAGTYGRQPTEAMARSIMAAIAAGIPMDATFREPAPALVAPAPQVPQNQVPLVMINAPPVRQLARAAPAPAAPARVSAANRRIANLANQMGLQQVLPAGRPPARMADLVYDQDVPTSRRRADLVYDQDVPTSKRRAALVADQDVPTSRRRAALVSEHDAPTSQRRAALEADQDVPTSRRRAALVAEQDAPTSQRRAAAQAVAGLVQGQDAPISQRRAAAQAMADLVAVQDAPTSQRRAAAQAVAGLVQGQDAPISQRRVATQAVADLVAEQDAQSGRRRVRPLLVQGEDAPVTKLRVPVTEAVASRQEAANRRFDALQAQINPPGVLVSDQDPQSGRRYVRPLSQTRPPILVQGPVEATGETTARLQARDAELNDLRAQREQLVRDLQQSRDANEEAALSEAPTSVLSQRIREWQQSSTGLNPEIPEAPPGMRVRMYNSRMGPRPVFRNGQVQFEPLPILLPNGPFESVGDATDRMDPGQAPTPVDERAAFQERAAQLNANRDASIARLNAQAAADYQARMAQRAGPARPSSPVPAPAPIEEDDAPGTFADLEALGSGSKVQAVAFPLDQWSSASALRWLRAHGYQPKKRGETTTHFLRYRIREPRFARYTTRIINSRGREIHLIIGV